MLLARIFILIALIQGVCAQDEQKLSTAASAVDKTAQALVLGAAFAEEKTADQSAKVLSAVESQNLIQLLDDPKKSHELISTLKKAVAREEQIFSPEGIFSFFKTWTNVDNFLYLLIALLRIGFILLVFIILWRSLSKFVDYYVKKIPIVKKTGISSKEGGAVFMTVAPIIRSTLHWMLIIVTFLLILSEMNINIMPIIYSFSVITLAISLGSQTLVKDLINGILTLFEGNMAVGDVVIIGQHVGVVETISLRCVHLRHGTGELQTIPFSEVTNIINCSRDFNVVDIQFTVSYQADLNIVNEALYFVYGALKNDTKFKHYLKSDLSIYGISELNEWGAKVHAGVKIIPDPGKAFINEFNRLLLLELQKRQIPLPATVLLASDIKDPKLGEA